MAAFGVRIAQELAADEPGGVISMRISMRYCFGIRLAVAVLLLLLMVGAASADTLFFNDSFENGLNFNYPNNVTNLTIPTYEGSGEAIHPSVYYNATGWNGYNYWMVYTPYPGSSAAKENPSIVASNNSISWEVPVGLTNPINSSAITMTNYGDPNIVYNPVLNKTEVYWYEKNTTHERIWSSNSSTGITWSAQYIVKEWSITVLNYTNPLLASPNFLWNYTTNNSYDFWYTNVISSTITPKQYIGSISTDWSNFNFSNATNVSLINNVTVSTHDFTMRKNTGAGYTLLVTGYNGTSNGVTQNYYYTCTNQTYCSFVSLAIPRTYTGHWNSFNTYKSDFLLDANDKFQSIWYSSRGGTADKWNTGYITSINKSENNTWDWAAGKSYLNTTFARTGSNSLFFVSEPSYVNNRPMIVYNFTSFNHGTGLNNVTEISVWGRDYKQTVGNVMFLLSVNYVGGGSHEVGVWTGTTNNFYVDKINSTYNASLVARNNSWVHLNISFNATHALLYANNTLVNATPLFQSNISDISLKGFTSGYWNWDDFEVYTAPQGAPAATTPNITSWSNNKTLNNTLAFTINTTESVNFNATANQTITTWTWGINSSDQSNNFDNITLFWATTGLRNISANATNINGTTQTIYWNVIVQATSPNTFIPPTPASLANTTGNYWANHTWAAGAGNITDSFNVSQNGTWTNGSANTYYNASVGAGNWSNISVWAFNNSGSGALSTSAASMNTQAPAAPTPTPTSAPASTSTTWTSLKNDTSIWEVLGGVLKISAIISIVVYIIGAAKGKIKTIDAITATLASIIVLIIVYIIIPIIGSTIGQI